MGINWRLHAACRPQSSGKVERINRTLKETLAKLHQETSLGWVDLLPLAVLWARCTPGKSGFSPFETMFRRPPPLLTSLPGDIRQLGFSSLQNQMTALGKVLTDVRAYILERAPISLGAPVHPGRSSLGQRLEARAPLTPVDRPSHFRTCYSHRS
ncbi:hypothetical protein mRhiFer1_009619 [Rhinolophus ferrumequinum]|uniref:Integrase catalytic domain-containing protein n=1 Tax=Rhinolophus ferrumequinum TaxID=59479 RepID=A0A7J7ZQN0_RHIFE|nr:hypothetical protein mRhiFer1_009619 [Rhinolophus ferrumequinum]